MTKEVEKVKTNGTEPNTADTFRVLHPASHSRISRFVHCRLDIPGSDKESIVAQINASTLTVSAKVQERFTRETALVYDNALPAEYRREFSLADDVETQTVDAVYELGVLKITLKKKQQFLPKEIKIA